MNQPTDLRIDTGVAAHGSRRGPEKIEVIIVDDRRVAAVGLRYGDLTAVGTARCHPKDRPDRLLGESIALARALHALARRIAADAQAKIDGAGQDRFAWNTVGIHAQLADAAEERITRDILG